MYLTSLFKFIFYFFNDFSQYNYKLAKLNPL